jgi:rpsU-divergently transcribed protein
LLKNILGKGFSMRLKKNILDTALTLVPNYGWTRENLVESCRMNNISSASVGLFPLGGVEIIYHLNNKINETLKSKEFTRKDNLVDQIIEATNYRLKLLHPYIEYWPHAIKVLGEPSNLPSSLYTLSETANIICNVAGDKSFDVINNNFNNLDDLVWKKNFDCCYLCGGGIIYD